MIERKGFEALRHAVAGLAGLAALSGAGAATFENLYTVTVPLGFELAEGQPRLTEDDYVELAMGRLLTRVTGRTEAMRDPLLGELVSNAPQYVVQRGYPDRDHLLVTFDARAVEDALVQRNQPIWGEERPLTLLWVAFDDGFGGRGVLAAGPPDMPRSETLAGLEQQLRAALQSAASDRGLPIALPLWDGQDRSAVDFIDVWGGFSDRLVEASARYGADAVLNGRVRLTERGFDVQWTLLRGRGQFILPGGTLGTGLEQLADRFAGEFSSIGGALMARISVVDVETLEDYGRVMRYVEGLSVLDAVDVEDFAGRTLTLRVAARGGTGVLERVLTLGSVLRALPSTTDARPGDHLAFSLTPSSARGSE